jgi:hypothetical protein
LLASCRMEVRRCEPGVPGQAVTRRDRCSRRRKDPSASRSVSPRKTRLRSRFPRKETVREMSRSSISKAAPCTCAPSAGLSPVKQFLVESVEGAAVDESGDSLVAYARGSLTFPVRRKQIRRTCPCLVSRYYPGFQFHCTRYRSSRLPSSTRSSACAQTP